MYFCTLDNVTQLKLHQCGKFPIGGIHFYTIKGSQVVVSRTKKGMKCKFTNFSSTSNTEKKRKKKKHRLLQNDWVHFLKIERMKLSLQMICNIPSLIIKKISIFDESSSSYRSCLVHKCECHLIKSLINFENCY